MNNESINLLNSLEEFRKKEEETQNLDTDQDSIIFLKNLKKYSKQLKKKQKEKNKNSSNIPLHMRSRKYKIIKKNQRLARRKNRR